MPTYDDKELSVLISSTLENFGFKPETVLLRSKCRTDLAEMTTEKVKKYYTPVVAGSSAEGLKLANSDLDVMRILDDSICVDKGYEDQNCAILESDYTNTCPGYTKVVAISIPSTLATSDFFNYLCFKGNSVSKTYLSSGKLKMLSSAVNTFFHNFDLSTNGPALTMALKIPSQFEFDNVFSVYFYGGKFLDSWAKRSRLYSWPPLEIVRKVSEMEGYIVPVGEKQSDNSNLEWRICYTSAEKDLVLSLSDTQMKVYVIMKMIAKYIFKPIYKELTSYVMKNIIFWVSERSHSRQFTVECLINATQNAIHFLRHCIQNNHLPNYMIPERNLLTGAFSGQRKAKVLNFLSECLEEGGTIILRIPRLYTCISLRVTHPDNVFMFGKWRDTVENKNLVFERQLFEDYKLSLPMDIDLNEYTVAEIINNYIFEKSMNIKCFNTFTSLVSLVVPELLNLNLSGMPFDNIGNIFGQRLALLNIL